jgi:hypothetical protein
VFLLQVLFFLGFPALVGWILRVPGSVPTSSSKGIGICSYLYTKDQDIVVFG